MIYSINSSPYIRYAGLYEMANGVIAAIPATKMRNEEIRVEIPRLSKQDQAALSQLVKQNVGGDAWCISAREEYDEWDRHYCCVGMNRPEENL